MLDRLRVCYKVYEMVTLRYKVCYFNELAIFKGIAKRFKRYELRFTVR